MSGHAPAGGRTAAKPAGCGVVFRIEWSVAFRRRRLFALNVGIPLLLVAPVALAPAPPAHAAAVYAVLFVLFGTFGQAIPLVRDAETGLLRRLVLAGLPPRAAALERILAGALVDTLQLLPATALILAAARPPAATAAALPLVLAGTLVAGNALGAWVAAAARSIAEAALFAAVAALLALHASGVFRTPADGSAWAAIERVAPFRFLHETLLSAAAGSAAPATHALAGTAAAAAVALAVTALLAPAALERLARAGRV